MLSAIGMSEGHNLGLDYKPAGDDWHAICGHNTMIRLLWPNSWPFVPNGQAMSYSELLKLMAMLCHAGRCNQRLLMHGHLTCITSMAMSQAPTAVLSWQRRVGCPTTTAWRTQLHLLRVIQHALVEREHCRIKPHASPVLMLR